MLGPVRRYKREELCLWRAVMCPFLVSMMVGQRSLPARLELRPRLSIRICWPHTGRFGGRFRQGNGDGHERQQHLDRHVY